MEWTEIAAVFLSVTSTISIAIAGAIIKYALNTNDRLARLEMCLRSVKEDIQEIKGWYKELTDDAEDKERRLVKLEEKIRYKLEE